MLEPRPDQPTVTATGESLRPRIQGVVVRRATTHLDERGELTEVFDPRWALDEDPLVYVYQIAIRPGKVKGWVVHREQDDRLFVVTGTIRFVLYDDREGSPTHGMINEIFAGERSRALIRIPRGVYHALQNVGHYDAHFVNMPTTPYRHEDPDKLRLPLDSDKIPFRFEPTPGW
jgi:dTDP-4-dehydrorhamnose 3,5-epimerase